jgi:site-specific DNA-adenine methylase
MSWIGGKKGPAGYNSPHVPLYYERYIEVFGGGGWILFAKPPGNDFEVYNDFNGLLVNLYRCVRDKPRELMASTQYVLNSREDFELVSGYPRPRQPRIRCAESGVVLSAHPLSATPPALTASAASPMICAQTSR